MNYTSRALEIYNIARKELGKGRVVIEVLSKSGIIYTNGFDCLKTLKDILERPYVVSVVSIRDIKNRSIIIFKGNSLYKSGELKY